MYNAEAGVEAVDLIVEAAVLPGSSKNEYVSKGTIVRSKEAADSTHPSKHGYALQELVHSFCVPPDRLHTEDLLIKSSTGPTLSQCVGDDVKIRDPKKMLEPRVIQPLVDDSVTYSTDSSKYEVSCSELHGTFNNYSHRRY